MNRTLSVRAASFAVIGIALAAPLSFAQAPAAAPDVAPHTCGASPKWPGDASNNRERLAFEREFKTWSECAKAYMDKNKLIINAHQKAVNVLVDEYNGVIDAVKKTRDAENKAGEAKK